MALPFDSDLDAQWLAFMQGQPLSIEAPEYGTVGGLPQPGQLPVPPPPPPPPPQQLGADVPQQQEVPAPLPMPTFDPGLDEQWRAAMQPQQAPPVLDSFGMNPATAVVPQENLEAPAPFDPLDPATWTSQVGAPVGRQRTTAAEGEMPLTEEEIGQLNPLQFQQYEHEHQQRKAQIAQQKLDEINKTAAAQAEERERAFMDAQNHARQLTESALLDAEALANEKPKKYMDSIGNALGAVAGIIMGQFGAAATGGKNVGLEMTLRRMDDFAKDQINEYNRKAGAVDRKLNIAARLRESGYNEYQTRTIIQMAGLARAREQALTEAQNFDPRGTAAMERMKFAQQARAQMLMNAEALRRQAVDDRTKELALVKSELEIAEKQAKLRGMGGAGAAKREPAYFEALGLPVPPMAMTDKEHEQWMRRSKLGKELGGNDAQSRKQEADAAKAEAEAEAARTGFQIANPETGDALVQPDGKPFVVMDAEERKRLRSITTAAVNIRKLADKMAQLKKKYGGAIKSLGSDEAQELQSLASAIDFETFKAFDLGAPSEGDKALAEGVRGGVDPTSFVKDATKGFQAYADAVEKKALGHLRGAGYKGEALKFTREADLPKPKPTEREQDLEVIIKSEYGGTTTDPSQAFGVAGGKRVVDPLSEDAPENIDLLFNRLIGKARAGDASAWKDIETISEKAISPQLRQRAAVILVERPR